MIAWFKKIFSPFRLPIRGEKVMFSDKVIRKNPNLYKDNCYVVNRAYGVKKDNIVHLDCGTVLYTGEWKIVSKDTPLKY